MTGMTGTLQLIAGAVPGWQPVQLQGAQHPAVFSPRSCRVEKRLLCLPLEQERMGGSATGRGSWEGNKQRGNTGGG